VLHLGEAVRVQEGALTLPQLLAADEIFLTNSLFGVMPVVGIDQQRYDLSRNPLTQTIRAAFQVMEQRSAGLG
jgi:4-amino-4-deoxychorismate lyase